MSRLLIGGFVAAAFAASPIHAQAAAKQAAPAVKSRAEVQAAVAQRFARMDANHDGFVSKAEVDALQAKRGERVEKRADPAKIFARLDANKDGNITRAEAEAALAARAVATGKPAANNSKGLEKLFERVDRNHDGVISRAEFAAAPPPAGKRAIPGQMFAKGDTNQDGRISLAEAQQAAVRQFDRFDLNHDGRITPEERTQARHQLRAQPKNG